MPQHKVSLCFTSTRTTLRVILSHFPTLKTSESNCIKSMESESMLCVSFLVIGMALSLESNFPMAPLHYKAVLFHQIEKNHHRPGQKLQQFAVALPLSIWQFQYHEHWTLLKHLTRLKNCAASPAMCHHLFSEKYPWRSWNNQNIWKPDPAVFFQTSQTSSKYHL